MNDSDWYQQFNQNKTQNSLLNTETDSNYYNCGVYNIMASSICIRENSEISQVKRVQGIVHNYISTRKQSNVCPIELNVDYDDGTLEFTWDCTNVEYESGTFARHIIIIDFGDKQQSREIINIIQLYYKKMKLGDFLKILTPNGNFKQNWIEKTSQKIESLSIEFVEKSKDLLYCCKKALNISLKYIELSNICIFTKCLSQYDTNILNLLFQYKNFKTHHYTLSVFAEIGTDFTRSKFLGSEILCYKSINDLGERLRVYFHEINKVRILQAQIRLNCLNAQAELSKCSYQFWHTVDKRIVYKLFSLNNYTQYSCGLKINGLNLNMAEFHVEFVVKMISGSTFSMANVFQLNIERVAQNIEDVQKMNQKFRCNHYSQLPRHMKVNPTKIEKLLLRKKFELNQCNSDYQRQSFY